MASALRISPPFKLHHIARLHTFHHPNLNPRQELRQHLLATNIGIMRENIEDVDSKQLPILLVLD
jgi:hypothetical protein